MKAVRNSGMAYALGGAKATPDSAPPSGRPRPAVRPLPKPINSLISDEDRRVVGTSTHLARRPRWMLSPMWEVGAAP